MNKTLVILPFLVLSLLAAIWTGWIRIGWPWPLSAAAGQHGALMVGSFLASLVFLERAITFKQRWVILLPVVNVISCLFFLFQQPLIGQLLLFIGQLLLLIGSAGFLLMCTYFIYRYKELYYYVFWIGAFSLLVGYVVLLKNSFYPAAVPWWMAFLLFTIVAERLELSRFLPLSNRKRYALLLALLTLLASLFIPFHSWGYFLFPLAMMATATWLLRFDMAWRSIKIQGQHRYSAQLLIVGYVWLLITGMLLLVSDLFPFGYDAALHSFFIGFTFSMIFSHAPIILPALVKLPLKLYRPVLYVWFILLQVSLLIRVAADVLGNFELRRFGGLLNGVAFLAFFISTAAIIRIELKKRKPARIV
jgi:hypothetical protein